MALGDDGLIVPVVHDAHELSAEGLAARIRDLAGRARDGALTPDEVRGGTFTITNPGQHGTLMATPVINQPQVAILDLEAVVKRAVVVEGADGADAVTVRPMCVLGSAGTIARSTASPPRASSRRSGAGSRPGTSDLAAPQLPGHPPGRAGHARGRSVTLAENVPDARERVRAPRRP